MYSIISFVFEKLHKSVGEEYGKVLEEYRISGNECARKGAFAFQL